MPTGSVYSSHLHYVLVSLVKSIPARSVNILGSSSWAGFCSESLRPR
jgi:hypothetical protein